MDFAREWYQLQEILHLTLPLPRYVQGKGQELELQWILPHRLNMKLLGRQPKNNYTDL